jgi:alanyl-tRNA synthetase
LFSIIINSVIERFTNVVQHFSTQGASGPEWATHVSKVIGGKAGGKAGAPTAIGQGTNADKIDEGVEEARKYIENFKI